MIPIAIGMLRLRLAKYYLLNYIWGVAFGVHYINNGYFASRIPIFIGRSNLFAFLF